ncbi:hypothetical protein [uncultured Flavobacterium sp.]|uniref:hypothetical protein n=1 Tax=uncultured Flavobacterium sp. TaxID=165435 RepID=UPI00292D6AF8|nr:hypothetical protein [uncultured Flavobacterium sp.]
MSIDHNRIKVSDLETNQPNKILTTNSHGELEFSDINNIKVDNYNNLDYTIEGKALDARQGKILKDSIDTLNVSLSGKENVNNKAQDIEINKNSISLFPSVKAIYDWATGLFSTWILGIENISSTTYTLNIANINKRTVFSSTNPITLTVPSNSLVSIPIGTKKEITQKNGGSITIGGTGITFVTNIPLTMTAGETRTLTKIGLDEWTIEGSSINGSKRSFSITFAWTGTYSANAGAYMPDRESGNLHSPTMSINNPSQGFAVPFKCKLKAAIHAGNALGSSDLTLYVFKRPLQSAGSTTIAASKSIIGTYSGGRSFPFSYGTEINDSVIWNLGDGVTFGFLNPTTSTGIWRTPSLTLYFEEEF